MLSKQKIKLLLFIALVATTFICYHYFSTPNDDKYVGYYENVHGLQKSAPVYYYGVLIGRVEDVLIEKKGQVLVLFSIHKNTKIAEGTIARITSDPLKGGMAVIFKPGSGKPLYTNAELPTMVDSSLTDQFHAKVSPLINKGEHYLKKIDSSLYKVIDLTDSNCSNSVQHRILKLKERLEGLSGKINHANKQVNKVVKGINSANATSLLVKKSSQSIASKIEASDSLSTKNMELSSVMKIKNNLNEANNKTKKIKTSKLIIDHSAYSKIAKKVDSMDKQLTKIKVKKLK